MYLHTNTQTILSQQFIKRTSWGSSGFSKWLICFCISRNSAPEKDRDRFVFVNRTTPVSSLLLRFCLAWRFALPGGQDLNA